MEEKRKFFRRVFQTIYYSNLYTILVEGSDEVYESLLYDVSEGGCRFKIINDSYRLFSIEGEYDALVGKKITIEKFKDKSPNITSIVGVVGSIQWVNKNMMGVMFDKRIDIFNNNAL